MSYVETRRQFLRDAFITLLGAGVLNSCSWATNKDRQKEILEKIETLHFTPGSRLKTTLLFRKIVWEMAQAKKKLDPKWRSNGDESDWLAHQDLLREGLQILKDAGIKGGRLVIFPFENDMVTYQKNEATYVLEPVFKWDVIETAISLMKEFGFEVDLAIGPIDYPYAPGIRLPSHLENMVREEFAKQKVNHITISSQEDETMPRSSVAIRDFCLHFTETLITKYGEDSRINTFCLSNEWPDNHGIEGQGLDGKTLSMSEELMLRIIEIIKSKTNKKISINTNINPSEPHLLDEKLGGLLNALGEQGILLFDTYPTEEEKIETLRQFMDNYKDLMATIRAEWPEIELGFGEFQAELFATGDIAGQSWAQIATDHMDLLIDYYELTFPKYIQSHMINSEIKEISLWGSPLLIVLYMLGYPFPIQMIKAITDNIEAKSNQVS